MTFSDVIDHDIGNNINDDLPQRYVVALTREDGKNDKLRSKLEELYIGDNYDDGDGTNSNVNMVQVLELPCIEHGDGPDYELLSETLYTKQWDYVAITSPEAAKVLGSVWKDAYGKTKNNDDEQEKQNFLAQRFSDNFVPDVVAVGAATERTLRQLDIPVAFVLSKATAKTLAMELDPKKKQ